MSFSSIVIHKIKTGVAKIMICPICNFNNQEDFLDKCPVCGENLLAFSVNEIDNDAKTIIKIEK